MSEAYRQDFVYPCIDREREYQDWRWNGPTQHEVAAWILFMEDYLEEARHLVSRNPDPEASRLALDNVRKVVAMGVACMEQHGIVKREEWIDDSE